MNPEIKVLIQFHVNSTSGIDYDLIEVPAEHPCTGIAIEIFGADVNTDRRAIATLAMQAAGSLQKIARLHGISSARFDDRLHRIKRQLPKAIERKIAKNRQA